MDNEKLIKVVEMDCPFCNKIHSIEQRKRTSQAIFKDKIIEYEEMFFVCLLSDEEENEFVPAIIMDENLLKVRDAYRVKIGLLTSNEIADIRRFYDLTQSDFSFLLGWGEVTVTRYESKTIQDETYDNIMRMAHTNPMFALACIDKHQERFSAKKYSKIRTNIINKVDEVGTNHLKEQEIQSLYVRFTDKNIMNGFKILDLEKVANVIAYFAKHVNNLYKVKLMKLLWYTDAIYFKRYGIAMTGLVYKHMPLGALPIGYDDIIHLPTITVEEEMIHDDISYKICTNKEVDSLVFSTEELNVIDTVIEIFKSYQTKEIINYMHQERAYIDTLPNDIIPFSYAKQLN